MHASSLSLSLSVIYILMLGESTDSIQHNAVEISSPLRIYIYIYI